MLGIKEELQIRRWAREEWDKKEAAKQAACEHKVSGSLRDDGKVYCDSCGKPLNWRDDKGGEPCKAEQRGIDLMRGAK